MIKGFIEVHNMEFEYSPVLINISHIVDIWDSTIYVDMGLANEDYPHIKCVESYEEIKDKIKKAVYGYET